VVDRGKVAEAAQEKTAQVEARHAALPAQPGQASLSDAAFGGKADIGRTFSDVCL
jgi:hypothetical protein